MLVGGGGTFSLGFAKDVHDLRLGGILAQSPDQVTALAVSDFHLVSGRPVKQLESIFKVCEEMLQLFSVFSFFLCTYLQYIYIYI